MPRVLSVHSEEEFQRQLGGKSTFGQSKGAVVDFTASWCGPCKMFAPIFDKMSDQFPDITFLKVDVDELQTVAQQCGVRAMPTCQAYLNGSKVDEVVGVDPRKLQSILEKVASQVTSTSGVGRKLAEGSAAPAAAAAGDDDVAARRARALAAAEARMKAAAP